MSKITRNEENNSIVFQIDDPSAFHCFQQGFNDRRQWSRHEETRELQNLVAANNRHAQIIVQYGDSYLPIKQTY